MKIANQAAIVTGGGSGVRSFLLAILARKSARNR